MQWVCFCQDNRVTAKSFVTLKEKTPEEGGDRSRQTPFISRQNQVVKKKNQ